MTDDIEIFGGWVLGWDSGFEDNGDAYLGGSSINLTNDITLSNAFVILDEAQNTTRQQMKMFLTRMGFGSKTVITGDITQTDLPRDTVSGLRHAVETLNDIDGISVTRFTSYDVVRHALVQHIIEAYDAAPE